MTLECIICRLNKNKSEFSIEHIIPEALGNSKLILDGVCKQCNDNMGSKVDCHLVNLELFSYPRIKLNLRGKTKKLPKLFEHALLDDGRPVKVKYNTLTKKINVEAPTIIKSERIGDKLKYEVKSSSVEDAIEKLKKSYKRNTGKILSEKDQKDIAKKFQQNTTIENPKIKCTYAIDMFKIDMAFLKIAYELIFHLRLMDINESEYLTNNKLKKIAEIISNYIYKDERAASLPMVNKIKEDDIKEGLKFLSQNMFDHKYFHSISIAAFRKERTIKYNINLLNSFDRYIIIEDIECRNYHTTIFMNPTTGEIRKN